MRSHLIHTLVRMALVGLFLATGLLVVGHPPTQPPEPRPPVQAAPAPAPSNGATSGYGAGATAATSLHSAAPALAEEGAVPADCGITNIPGCAQAALSAILAPITQTILVFCDAVLKNLAAALTAPATATALPPAHGGDAAVSAQTSFNFLTQTPLCFSTVYSACRATQVDGAIATVTGWTQLVVSWALVFLIVVGGLTFMLGTQMGMRVHGVAELIPRVALTFLAAWMAPAIVQAFIDLDNLLCQGVLQAAQISGFASNLAQLAASPTFASFLSLLFLIMASVMVVLLIGQMALRLGFVALLGGLAPLGLFCFALPQTLGWGKLWMQQFSMAVFIQFVQVAALALGGSLMAALAVPTTTLFGGVPDAATIVGSILLTMMLYLTFKLPTMIQSYAGRYVTTDINRATMQTLEGVGELVAAVAA